MTIKIFHDFVSEEKTPEGIITSYTGKIPEDMLEVWKQYGFGSILGGYLKIVNPDEFQPLLKDVYVRNQNAIALFTTSMGDIIVWEDNKYLILLNFRRGKMKGISSGFKYFFSDLEDTSFLDEDMDWMPYLEAVNKFGVPTFNECFGYVPILGLGGPEKVENLSRVKLVEHIYLITQFMGPIE
jgi:hypothetical protein